MRLISYLAFLLPVLSLLAQTDCKLRKETLRPLIQNTSPFFYRLTWDEKNKIEKAQLDELSELQITQSGCDRHHMAFVFKFPQPDSSVILPEAYWPSLAFIWLDRVFQENLSWQLYRQEFRKQLLRFYDIQAAPGQTFNFPILERNFFYYETAHQGKVEIHLEIVKYLYNDRVRRPGVEEESYEE
jgi:hypothetical protein